jgi:hypothetical protein
MIQVRTRIKWYPKHALSSKKYDSIYRQLDNAKTKKQLRTATLLLLDVLYDMDERLLDLQKRVNEQGYKIER